MKLWNSSNLKTHQNIASSQPVSLQTRQLQLKHVARVTAKKSEQKNFRRWQGHITWHAIGLHLYSDESVSAHVRKQKQVWIWDPQRSIYTWWLQIWTHRVCTNVIAGCNAPLKGQPHSSVTWLLSSMHLPRLSAVKKYVRLALKAVSILFLFC